MRILKRNDEQRAIVIVLLRESVHFQPCMDMFLSEKDRLLKWAKASWNSRNRYSGTHTEAVSIS